MTLAETMQTDAAAVLADLPAEPAVYYPHGGAARPINVVIDRESEAVNTAPRAPIAPVTVYARNSATAGISSTEVTALDRLRLAQIKDGPHVMMRIARVIDDNPGWVELEVTT